MSEMIKNTISFYMMGFNSRNFWWRRPTLSSPLARACIRPFVSFWDDECTPLHVISFLFALYDAYCLHARGRDGSGGLLVYRLFTQQKIINIWSHPFSFTIFFIDLLCHWSDNHFLRLCVGTLRVDAMKCWLGPIWSLLKFSRSVVRFFSFGGDEQV